LAREVAGDGVTVNSLQPGLHATNRLQSLHAGEATDLARTIPAREFGRPEDFGRVAAFLCSDHARFVTGTALPVDGGTDAGLM
jgi:3-oxoacyl-[acyl-carrier protein] reductase